jgi:hypothetical protein
MITLGHRRRSAMRALGAALLLLAASAPVLSQPAAPAPEAQPVPPQQAAPSGETTPFAPGFLDALGRWFSQSAEGVNAGLKGTQETLTSLGGQAGDAAPTPPSVLPAPPPARRSGRPPTSRVCRERGSSTDANAARWRRTAPPIAAPPPPPSAAAAASRPGPASTFNRHGNARHGCGFRAGCRPRANARSRPSSLAPSASNVTIER